MSFTPKCLATGIGSFPHPTPEQAVDLVLASIPDAPVWPQLPTMSLNEQMEIQYSEGLPRRHIEADKRRMYFDTTGDTSEDLAAFYEAYLAAMDPDAGNGDCSAMAIGPEFSRGIYAMEKRLKAEGKKRPFVKVQVTGPLSFSLTIVDQDKRALYYNDEFRDVVVKALAMKARWQIQKFRPFADNVICFIDEPILAGFGSSTYVSVGRDDVVAILGEVIEAIHADGGLAGVHVCANTEWSMLIDAGVDLVNFDAFEYGETIALYPEHVKKLFDRSGALAWGILPTSPKIREQDVDRMVAHFDRVVDHLAKRTGIDKALIVRQSAITPSCGTGSLSVEDSTRVFSLLGPTSAALKKKYGLD
ncbi:MAG: hypothetical protein BIFFINMI_04352 [Phycisphaerae bacterium]|nr:hypothetical protein [Phycisphaerae bacterium]